MLMLITPHNNWTKVLTWKLKYEYMETWSNGWPDSNSTSLMEIRFSVAATTFDPKGIYKLIIICVCNRDSRHELDISDLNRYTFLVNIII